MVLTQRKLEKLISKQKLGGATRKIIGYLVSLEVSSKGQVSNMIEKAARIRNARKK